MEEAPLSDVMKVHPDEEDESEDDNHPPEFTAPPLRQARLRQELTTQIGQLLTAWLSYTTLAREWRPEIRLDTGMSGGEMHSQHSLV